MFYFLIFFAFLAAVLDERQHWQIGHRYQNLVAFSYVPLRLKQLIVNNDRKCQRIDCLHL